MKLVLLLASVVFTFAGRKNILFMLVDDGGFELAPWGNNITRTPNIAKLADMGTVFERAYTAVSSCSPSRSAILSGLPTHQNGMYGLHQFPGNFQSNPGTTSMPNILNAAGYKTGVIGKYHVGPVDSYNFTYGLGQPGTECWAGAAGCTVDGGYNMATRNITFMKQNARKFLQELEPNKPFFLYVGFGDCHRCKEHSALGAFCENYGADGSIPDWTPTRYTPDQVEVPPFMPDNPASRQDIAGQYTAVDRMDAGVGVMLEEVRRAGQADNTLVIFFSDNGIPFPAGKTNLFSEQGMGEPLIVYDPTAAAAGRGAGATVRSEVVSSLDFLPTVLDWTGTSYPPHASSGPNPASLLGSSLLPLLASSDSSTVWRDSAFASHNFHSLYNYYPTRAVTARVSAHHSAAKVQFRLVHNLNFHLTFGILEDLFDTPLWQGIQAAAQAGKPTGWVYNYSQYMNRPEFQLFDVDKDPMGLHNLAGNGTYSDVLATLKTQLAAWRKDSYDPWNQCNVPATAHECSI